MQVLIVVMRHGPRQFVRSDHVRNAVGAKCSVLRACSVLLLDFLVLFSTVQ